jgi:hypothetical protein
MLCTAWHACAHGEEGSMARGRRRRERRGGRDGDRGERPSEADRVEEARERAEQRVALVAEFWRFVFIVGLMLIFVTPIGVVVGFFWGIGLAKRYFALVEAPRLRRRWMEEELGRRIPEPGEREPAASRPRLVAVRLVELAEAALTARAQRIQRGGVALRREADADGVVSGDRELLQQALGELLDAALDELELAGDPSPRLDVEVGESLAGTEVWLRVRAESGRPAGRAPSPPARRPGLAAAREIVEAHGGAFESHDAPGAGFEAVLTFPKRDGRSVTASI